MENTGWKVSGYIHENPIYWDDKNWKTELFVWDYVICAAWWFWSEDLDYLSVYEVDKNENNEFVFIDSLWKEIPNSWNVVPFMLKIVPRLYINTRRYKAVKYNNDLKELYFDNK